MAGCPRLWSSSGLEIVSVCVSIPRLCPCEPARAGETAMTRERYETKRRIVPGRITGLSNYAPHQLCLPSSSPSPCTRLCLPPLWRNVKQSLQTRVQLCTLLAVITIVTPTGWKAHYHCSVACAFHRRSETLVREDVR